MKNCIQIAMADQSITAAELSRRSGVAYGTVYDIWAGKSHVEKMNIDTFLKIAHGLGMTAEELYYGKPAEKAYRDARQASLNAHFETFNDRGRDELSTIAERMSHDPSVRIEKDSAEHAEDDEAVGA